MTGRGAAATGPGRRVAFYTDAQAWPGGAETHLTGLMRWLASTGWDVSLFTSDRPATAEWVRLVRAEGIPVGLFRPTREVDVRGAAEAARLLRGFGLVHFNKTHVRTCLPAIGAARRAGARVVVSTEHVTARPGSRYPWGTRVVTELVRGANRRIDRIIVVSEASRREYVTNFRCDPRKVALIPGGVDLSRFDSLPSREDARRRLGLPSDAVVAVSVGRLCRGKGQDAAIAASARVREAHPRFVLCLVGEGETEEELRALASARGLDDVVVFAGARSDVVTWLAAADLFVLASESETQSLVLLEAMAAGLPVVSTDCGGPREAVDDGVTGRLVPCRDAGALADAVAGVLASPDRGAAMGRAGRARVRAGFDARTCHARVAALYEELLAAAEGSGA